METALAMWGESGESEATEFEHLGHSYDRTTKNRTKLSKPSSQQISLPDIINELKQVGRYVPDVD